MLSPAQFTTYGYLFLSLFVTAVISISKHPILIVVSYDAFGYKFVERETLPYTELIRHKGVYADYLTNIFPTKTFPNHHSIATGLYAEVHGVIGNSFYDPQYKKVIKIGYEMYHYNEQIRPIWRLNEDMGDDRFSGTIMWPGSDLPYQGKNITWALPFEAGYDWHQRVNQALSWIMDEKKPANLIMLYFEEPDTHGHAFGPNSAVVKDFIHKLDNITGYLHEQLEVHGLTDYVNVIHLSDHGMTGVKPPHFINITQYIKNGTYEWAGASPAIQIIPHEGHQETIYNALKAGSKENGHYRVFNKSEYLDRWHYKKNRRAPPILVLADVGYALDDLIIAAPLYAKKYNFTLTNESEFGVHGYDYIEPDMHPYFMAVGPKIKTRTKVNPFHTLDLLNLFCAILEIQCTENNGTLYPTEQILRKSDSNYSVGSVIMISVGGVLLALILISLAVVFTLIVIKRQQNITTAAALNKRFPQTFQNYIEAQHLLEPEEA